MPRCEFDGKAITNAICRDRIPAVDQDGSRVSRRGLRSRWNRPGHERKSNWRHGVTLFCGLTSIHLRCHLAQTLNQRIVCAFRSWRESAVNDIPAGSRSYPCWNYTYSVLRSKTWDNQIQWRQLQRRGTWNCMSDPGSWHTDYRQRCCALPRYEIRLVALRVQPCLVFASPARRWSGNVPRAGSIRICDQCCVNAIDDAIAGAWNKMQRWCNESLSRQVDWQRYLDDVHRLRAQTAAKASAVWPIAALMSSDLRHRSPGVLPPVPRSWPDQATANRHTRRVSACVRVLCIYKHPPEDWIVDRWFRQSTCEACASDEDVWSYEGFMWFRVVLAALIRIVISLCPPDVEGVTERVLETFAKRWNLRRQKFHSSRRLTCAPTLLTHPTRGIFDLTMQTVSQVRKALSGALQVEQASVKPVCDEWEIKIGCAALLFSGSMTIKYYYLCTFVLGRTSAVGASRMSWRVQVNCDTSLFAAIRKQIRKHIMVVRESLRQLSGIPTSIFPRRLCWFWDNRTLKFASSLFCFRAET